MAATSSVTSCATHVLPASRAITCAETRPVIATCTYQRKDVLSGYACTYASLLILINALPSMHKLFNPSSPVSAAAIRHTASAGLTPVASLSATWSCSHR